MQRGSAKKGKRLLIGENAAFARFKTDKEYTERGGER